MGPPRLPPNWFWVFCPRLGLKNGRAFNFVLRRNSYAEPWNVFVPERVVTLITPPRFLPYSAPNRLVSTLNSLRNSRLGVPSPSGALFSALEIGAPSTIRLLLPRRAPLTLIVSEPVPGLSALKMEPTTPAEVPSN